MKQIPLTQGKVALVDDEDYDFLMQWKWHTHKHWNTYCAVRWQRPGLGECESNKTRKLVHMHREIIKCPPDLMADHKDGNGLNNQKENLRVATNAQNQMNGKSRKGSSSKYKGVTWDKNIGKWVAQIIIEGRRKYLGLYVSEEDAARAYNTEAKKHFGEFVLVNEV